MANEFDDDVSTIVLDFGDLKSKLDEQEDILEDQDSVEELAFATDTLKQDSTATSLKALAPYRKIYLVAYTTEFFTKHQEIFEILENYEILEDMACLNKAITESPDAIFIMYFNDTPKAINQISAQLKRKFPESDSVIIAKNLSDAKAKQHKESKYGANEYLNEPFTPNDLEETLSHLL
mgnify:FL=1